MKEKRTRMDRDHQDSAPCSTRKKTHKTHDQQESRNDHKEHTQRLSSETHQREKYQETALMPAVAAEAMLPAEDAGVRERLKRHSVEVAGRVWIPDIWGQEELLKDWIDCSAFDASLVPTGIMSAREALAEEGRRANSSGLRIENRC
jgi:hypothetical protein